MEPNHEAHVSAASEIDRILEHNRRFIENSEKQSRRGGMPGRHLAVFTCMDTRLTKLLPHALGIDDGDAVVIKTAGAAIVDPYGEAMRSLLVAIGELGIREVMVIGHTECGTCGMSADHLLHALEQAGVPTSSIEQERRSDSGATHVLNGFEKLEDEVRATVEKITTHPLVPANVIVRGFIIDIHTGELSEL